MKPAAALPEELLPETKPVHIVHEPEVEFHDKDTPPEERNILAAVPSLPSERISADGAPPPEAYRQSLKIILGTPEIESRLNYITAGLIVTTFGGWLTIKALKSNAFRIMVDLLILFFVAGIMGAIVGILLGRGFISLDDINLMLLAAFGIMSFVFGIFLASASITRISNDTERSCQSQTRHPKKIVDNTHSQS